MKRLALLLGLTREERLSLLLVVGILLTGLAARWFMGR